MNGFKETPKARLSRIPSQLCCSIALSYFSFGGGFAGGGGFGNGTPCVCGLGDGLVVGFGVGFDMLLSSSVDTYKKQDQYYPGEEQTAGYVVGRDDELAP